ncbi:hypothetical protein RchiOBHm_Chr6g0281451 [Rosa chinensis]|uniref:Uncharacterized protein n=1 Tax=Rosa chinensis TaxID=74649 RepID=A0A2P6PTJ2_ROSCH|nr:hypothetical protein RchiOBHm_Chr6g0281451 [Rosa chinensis]
MWIVRIGLKVFDLLFTLLYLRNQSQIPKSSNSLPFGIYDVICDFIPMVTELLPVDVITEQCSLTFRNELGSTGTSCSTMIASKKQRFIRAEMVIQGL